MILELHHYINQLSLLVLLLITCFIVKLSRNFVTLLYNSYPVIYVDHFCVAIQPLKLSLYYCSAKAYFICVRDGLSGTNNTGFV